MMLSSDLAIAKQPYFRAASPAERAELALAPAAIRELGLTVYDNLPAIESEWRVFQERADCTVFQTCEWLSCWQRHIGAPNGAVPCIVVVRDSSGTILLVLPLAVGPRGIGRELVWLGSDLCDYNAPLLAPDFSQRVTAADFPGLWRRILDFVKADPRFRFDMIRLDKMPMRIGQQPNPMAGLPAALHPSGSYATPLAKSWEDFYAAKRSSATRRRDRSKRNRLAEFGDIKFTTPDNSSGILDTLTVLMAQKSAWFAKNGIANLFMRPDYVAFYRDFASNPQTRRLAHVSRVEVGAQIVSANFGLTFRGRYYYVLASYTDGELSRLGPGALHLRELFGYAIDHALSTFDFTVGDERYKLDWCDGVHPLYDHIAVATARGAVMAAPTIARTWLKRKIKQTPWLWAGFSKARALAASLPSRRRGT
jgi:CelD/BcsL family acetyltransferase involved in cellulose biosynthesis